MTLRREKSNAQLTHVSIYDDGSQFDLISSIAANGPIQRLEDASMVAHTVNNILAFVEYGATGDVDYPPDMDSVCDGLREIIKATRLLSLRVEQFIETLREEEKNKKHIRAPGHGKKVD